MRRGQVSSGYFSSSSGNTHFNTFTFTEDMYLRISHFKNPGSMYDIMLVKGSYTKDTMPEYEPCKKAITTEIYLKEPLRKFDNTHVDYIDFRKGKVVRWVSQNNTALSTPIEEEIVLPELPLYEGYSNIMVETKIEPSKIEINY